MDHNTDKISISSSYILHNFHAPSLPEIICGLRPAEASCSLQIWFAGLAGSGRHDSPVVIPLPGLSSGGAEGRCFLELCGFLLLRTLTLLKLAHHRWEIQHLHLAPQKYLKLHSPLCYTLLEVSRCPSETTCLFGFVPNCCPSWVFLNIRQGLGHQQSKRINASACTSCFQMEPKYLKCKNEACFPFWFGCQMPLELRKMSLLGHSLESSRSPKPYLLNWRQWILCVHAHLLSARTFPFLVSDSLIKKEGICLISARALKYDSTNSCSNKWFKGFACTLTLQVLSDNLQA